MQERPGMPLIHDAAAPAVELGHHALELRVRPGERRERGVLRNGVGVGGGVALVVGHGLGHFHGRGGVSNAPAGHGVGLGHAVDGDGARLDLVAQGGDGDVLRAVIDKVFVDLVRDDVEVVLDGEPADVLKLLAGVDKAVGVVGGVQDDGARPACDGGLDLAGQELKAVLLPRLHDDGNAARHAHQLRVAHPEGTRHDDLVPLVQQRLEGVEQGVLRAVGDHDLARLVVQAVVAQELLADGLLEVHRARSGRIPRHALVQGLLCGLADVLGRIKIRLARAKAHDVQALGLHLLGLGVDLQRDRTLDILTALGYSHLASPFLNDICSPIAAVFAFAFPLGFPSGTEGDTRIVLHPMQICKRFHSKIQNFPLNPLACAGICKNALPGLSKRTGEQRTQNGSGPSPAFGGGPLPA